MNIREITNIEYLFENILEDAYKATFRRKLKAKNKKMMPIRRNLVMSSLKLLKGKVIPLLLVQKMKMFHHISIKFSKMQNKIYVSSADDTVIMTKYIMYQT